jgi:hypothetical protein
MVEEKWKSIEVDGSATYCLVKKLSMLRDHLRAYKREIKASRRGKKEEALVKSTRIDR